MLALPVCCVTWTLTHEEIFREVQDWLADKSEHSRFWIMRKFYFAPTCDFCLSHYVAGGLIAATGFQIMLDDWRGYILRLTVTAVANIYLSAFAHIRVELRKERTELREVEGRTKRRTENGFRNEPSRRAVGHAVPRS